MNNFDKIKAMDIDEMAELLSSNTNCGSCNYVNECPADKNCNEVIKQWLLAEVEE